MSYLKLKHFLFLLVLLVSCALCSSHSETDDEARAPKRRPSPPRRPPPPPRRPPPPPRSPPPPPRRPPPPPRSPPPPPRRPPPPPRSPPPPPTSPPPTSSSPPPPSRPKPGYDYFILSLQWPNGLCSEVPCKPSPPEQQYFTVHGLWPQNNQGPAPEYCEATPVTDEILLGLKDGLMTYWPRLYSAKNFEYSKKLWTDQWSKHGSCSSNKFPAKEYFERGIALGEEYGQKILNYLKDGAVKPDGTTKHSYTKISKAINQGMGKEVKVIITCTNNKDDKLQLSEIRLCFDADAETLKSCTKGSSTCNGGFIFASEPPPPPPPPPRRYPPTYTPSLGLVSFKLDVEETAEF